MVAIICFIIVSSLLNIISAVLVVFRNDFVYDDTAKCGRIVIGMVCIMFALIILFCDSEALLISKGFTICTYGTLVFQTICIVDFIWAKIVALAKFIWSPFERFNAFMKSRAEKRENLKADTTKVYKETVEKAKKFGIVITPELEGLAVKALSEHNYSLRNDPIRELVVWCKELTDAYENLPNRNDGHTALLEQALGKIGNYALKYDIEKGFQAEDTFSQAVRNVQKIH